jgi:hypothetical protein
MRHPARPPRRSREQREWVLERVRAYLARGGHPSRDAFVVAERACGGVTKDAVQDCGGWGSLLREARDVMATAAAPAEPVADVEEIEIDLSDLDPPLPPIPRGHHVRGVSTLVNAEGATVAQWVKTGRDHESREELLERLLRELPQRVPMRVGSIAPPLADERDVLAVYPIGDAHVGMLSWAPETGESFDLDKAREIMCAAIDALVERGPRTEQALIVNLGDFLHSDNEQNRTARSGHALDVDGRWPKVLRIALDILVYMIDRTLAHHERVRVINEIGNHDDHSAMFLSVALDAYYRQEPRVEIDLSPSRFHWHRFGKCLIGVTHGHNQKPIDLEAIMAAERAQDWGQTEHRYWYAGHVHHATKLERRGCMIETFRTLSPRDAWAANAGYRSGRDMHRISLHREYGEIGREIVSAHYLQSQYLGRSAA